LLKHLRKATVVGPPISQDQTVPWISCRPASHNT
jgi:hypothetical protein